MREANHPADGRFGNGSVDGARRDHHEHIGRRAGGHIDLVVTDTESSDGQ